MFTDAQMETYDALRNRTFPGSEDKIPVDADWQPPRVAFAGDFPALADSDPEFHESPILLAGYTCEDLVECECDNSHVTYMPIRSDGMIGPLLTSNTIGEASVTSGMDPLTIILSGISPDELEPIFPTWDAAREVTPDEWPIGESAQPTVTDMADFEAILSNEDRF